MITAYIPNCKFTNRSVGYSNSGAWHSVVECGEYINTKTPTKDPPFSTLRLKYQQRAALKSLEQTKRTK